MADVIVTIKIMPESINEDLEKIKEKAIKKINEFGGELGKEEIEPVAFGLKALKLIIVYNESKGSPDALEEAIKDIEGVQSAESVDVRRAIG